MIQAHDCIGGRGQEVSLSGEMMFPQNSKYLCSSSSSHKYDINQISLWYQRRQYWNDVCSPPGEKVKQFGSIFAQQHWFTGSKGLGSSPLNTLTPHFNSTKGNHLHSFQLHTEQQEMNYQLLYSLSGIFSRHLANQCCFLHAKGD